jgi:hypothetical protein
VADIATIPSDVYALFDPTADHVVNEENLDAFTENLKQLIRGRLLGSTRTSGAGVLRFSSLGRPDRQLWYMANQAEGEGEQFSGKTLLKFLYGDVIEQLLLLLVKEAGHEVGQEQEELEVDGVKGHIDAVIDGVTTDVKSASPQGYTKFARGTLFEDDPFGYIGQISGYASIVTPETGGAFLAFDKVHGDICVLRVGPTITNDFSVSKRVAHLREVIASPRAPKRCYADEADGKSGNRKLGTQCSYCAFKQQCWPDLRTFLYSGRPRFLTETVRVPDVPEVTRDDEVLDEG